MIPGLNIEPRQERHFGRWLTLLLIVCLLGAAGYFAYNWYMKGDPLPVPIAAAAANPNVDETTITKKMVEEYKVEPNKPRYISIPSLNIQNTRVLEVGVTKNNVLDTPKNINDTAWYTKSATPGTGYGAVLIDGHNGGVTKDGVFAKLSSIQRSDVIKVERGDGKIFSYIVLESKTMSLDEANASGMKEMMRSAVADKEGLNLITCAGNWVPRIQQFDKRIMIRAVATTN